ncbi:MAG: hypothetical protein PHX87_01520 [Candidatus Peribacteraceae bacterium]|nr:hypothetical protein [Candidatus Peribacteraceae bacterium]MDD5742086.1 hypothetical protein [Candidatus Peribacteraceae bacterium]
MKDYPVDGAVVIGLIGFCLIGGWALGSLRTVSDWGRHCVGGAVMLAGYLIASL